MSEDVLIEQDDSITGDPDFNSNVEFEFESGDKKVVLFNFDNDTMKVDRIKCSKEEMDAYIQFFKNSHLPVDEKAVRSHF